MADTTTPFKESLNEEQKQSINDLTEARPSSQWNETDINNWNYATNNAPLPQTPELNNVSVSGEQSIASQGIDLKKAGEVAKEKISNVFGGQNMTSTPTQTTTPAQETAQSPETQTGEFDNLSMQDVEGQVLSPAQQEYKAISEETQAIMSKHTKDIEAYTRTLADQNRAAVESIKASFEARRQAQTQINKAVLNGQKLSGARSGRQRYATEIQSSIISSEETAGIQRLADLDRQEQELILQAERAATEQQWEALNMAYSSAIDIQTQKENTLVELNKIAQDEENRMYKMLEESRSQERFGMEKEQFAQTQKENARVEEQYNKEEAMSYVDQLTPDMLSQIDPMQAEQLASQAGILDLEGYVQGLENSRMQEQEQAMFERAKEMAGITGYFGEEMTADERQRVANNYFKETGMQLDEMKFNEMIRQNNFKNTLAVENYDLKVQQYNNELIKLEAELNDPVKAEMAQLELEKLRKEVTGEDGGKPPTPDQYKAAGFATRIDSSINTLAGLEGYINNLNVAEFQKQKVSPNFMRSPEFQQFEQAQREFINAQLRRESGAVISDEEFDNAEKQYFPQPGDSSEVLKQKKESRETALNNLKRESGSAYVDPVMAEMDNIFGEFDYSSLAEGFGESDVGFKKVGGDTDKASPLIRFERAKEVANTTFNLERNYKPGTKGGQCVTFLHKMYDFPPVGDTLAEKRRNVKKYGISPEQWRNEGIRPGDIIFTDESRKWGHGAAVRHYNPKTGEITLFESNFRGPEIISNDRKLSINDKGIFGVIRPGAKA